MKSIYTELNLNAFDPLDQTKVLKILSSFYFRFRNDNNDDKCSIFVVMLSAVHIGI